MKSKSVWKVFVLAGLAVLLLAAAGGASDRVYTLTVQNHDPASSICGQYLEAWGAKITEASGGRLQFVFYHGSSLVSAGDAVDAVLNGVADMAWSVPGIYAGRFPITDGLMLLSGNINARMGSKILMDLLAELPEMQDEYRDFKVIQLSACSYHPLSLTSRRPEKIEDVSGLRVRTAGVTASNWARAVGMSPMTVPTPETYESLQRNVIDGCMNDWHNLAAFSLMEVLSYIIDYPVHVSSLFILMNKDVFESLPQDLRDIIDLYSGSYASDMAGIYWDSTRAWILDTAADYGVEVYEPSPELVAAFDAVRGEVHAEYISRLNGMGLNGQRIYDKIMEVAARYEGMYDFSQPVNISDFTGHAN